MALTDQRGCSPLLKNESEKDNGIGIAKENQDKIYEIFHRLNSEVTPGEGLRLTIEKTE